MPRASHVATLRTVRDVAIGGAAGALLRTTVALFALAVVGHDLVVMVALNLLGTYLLARLLARARRVPAWQTRTPLLGTGLMGSLTTFSGLVVPLALLTAEGRILAATLAALANLVTGVVVAAWGLRESPT